MRTFPPLTLFRLFCFAASGMLIFLSFYEPFFSMKAEEEKKPMISHQHRFGIIKDLWINQKEGRHHHHLISPQSTVTLIPGETGIDAVEHMQQIRCWLQDKVDPALNEQKIQYIKAEEGTYFYKDQEFLAKQLIFAFYDQKGCDLTAEIHPSPLFFKGKAEQAYFQLHHHHPKFDADHFQLEIDEK